MQLMNWIAPTALFLDCARTRTAWCLSNVIVTACIVAGAGAAFNNGATGPIKTALTGALSTIGTAVTTAVGG
jgi:hypothetical protein